MKNKITAILIIFMMIASLVVIIVQILPTATAPTVIYVDDVPGSGPGNPAENYTIIQDAIDASNPGDTIYVYNGIYYEWIEIFWTLTLIGENSSSTIIDSNFPDHHNGILILGNWVNVSGFGVTNTYYGHEYGGIAVHGHNTTISDTRCWDNQFGMTIWSTDNRILNNDFSSNGKAGIRAYWAGGNLIDNNICSDSWYSWGMWFDDSSGNIITNNTFISNNKSGILLYKSHFNYVYNNKMTKSINKQGLDIYDSRNNSIIDNSMSENVNGITLDRYADNNTFSNNTISKNSDNGIWIRDSANNNTILNNLISENTISINITDTSYDTLIYHNNMIANLNLPIDESNNNNSWDNGYPSGGNFWSDYNGVDYNSTPFQNVPPPDGIGDTPYVIDPDSQDNYPLTTPAGNFLFLQKGWNLISIPNIQLDMNLNVVLSSISGYYDAVQWYDASDSTDNWKHNQVTKSGKLNDLNILDHEVGFWIHIINRDWVMFEYHGTQPVMNQIIQLHKGWNIVGYPSLTTYNRTVGLNGLHFDSDVDCIQLYDAATQTWHFMDQEDSFVPGRGYWMHSKVDTSWEVPL
jgi:parallel beta-helix repeat protein